MLLAMQCCYVENMMSSLNDRMRTLCRDFNEIRFCFVKSNNEHSQKVQLFNLKSRESFTIYQT